ncbi:MAG: cobalamin B12-binding domain-containing protein [Chitinophagales bacterium]|nr:cobalamin B12-binding domain-containing protein [Chitinophagales bacterium]
MKIFLIKPPILHKGVSFARYATPPLGLAYIAGSLLKEGHELKVIDASAEGINDKEIFKRDVFVFGLNKEKIAQKIDKDVDIICFSFMFTSNWLYDKELINYLKLKFPKATLIAGGEHVNAMPEHSLRN